MRYIHKLLLLFPVCLTLLCACGDNREAWYQGDARPLPVLMYHSILKDPKRAGSYIVSPDTFEKDLLYLMDAGYTTVTAAELIAFADGTGDLPPKPVLITLDDGYYNNLTYVLPILQRYDARAVISVVGGYCDRYTLEPDPNPNYAYLSWEETALLTESGLVEIGNHTYDMHGRGSREGCARLAGENDEAYRRAMMEDIGAMQAALRQRANVDCRIFAYPYGKTGRGSGEILSELGFRMALTCREQVNEIFRGERDCLMELGRFNRPAFLSTQAFMDRCLGLN